MFKFIKENLNSDLIKNKSGIYKIICKDHFYIGSSKNLSKRLYSHINQMRDNLNLDEPVGRKLDFIVQEMNREANTIASKANDIRVTNISINIKNEIEKIREQIQNIE